MMRHVLRPSVRVVLSVVSTLVGLACCGAPVFAATVAAGCNPNIWTALTAKAAAQVAYDSAVTRQMINKPDSVLTLTCFDQAAGISANKGGAIFSGDFTTQLQTIMPVNGAGTFTCTGIGDLWNTIVTAGVNTGAPYATLTDNLMPGTVPGGGGADFNAGWTAASTAGVFSTLNTAVTALPGPPAAIDFTAAKSSCDVLVAAKISSATCPTAATTTTPTTPPPAP